jgi:pimeloyl-ACP methyl ester carboxylesterase
MILPPQRLVRLPGGRCLAVDEYGDPEGRVVFYCHGLPGSRALGEGDPLRDPGPGLRILAVDRPGLGHSDPHPRRGLIDWADDVDALCDRLSIARASLLGVSGGGPFALACAWRQPQRFERVVILNGLAPLDRRGATQGMSPALRAGWWFVAHLPLQARFAADAQRAALHRRPRKLVGRLARAMADVDRAALERAPAGVTVQADLALAFRQGSAAVAQEMRLLSRPWGFDPGQITVPVELWHGSQDRTVPLSMGRWLAERIPGAQLHERPEMGHLLHRTIWQEVRAALLK